MSLAEAVAERFEYVHSADGEFQRFAGLAWEARGAEPFVQWAWEYVEPLTTVFESREPGEGPSNDATLVTRIEARPAEGDDAAQRWLHNNGFVPMLEEDVAEFNMSVFLPTEWSRNDPQLEELLINVMRALGADDNSEITTLP